MFVLQKVKLFYFLTRKYLAITIYTLYLLLILIYILLIFIIIFQILFKVQYILLP
jgi:hypothetical protein